MTNADKASIMLVGRGISVLLNGNCAIDDDSDARSIFAECIREFADMIDTQRFNEETTHKLMAYSKAKLELCK